MAYGPTSIGGYMALSPATKEDIGGVKIGNGINVAEDGTISVNVSVDTVFPVGSIYLSKNNTSPAELFGGTWAEIASERVLMGASSTHAAGTTVEAGLPNITGQVPSAKTWNGGHTWSISGSFAWTNTRPNEKGDSGIFEGDKTALMFYQADFNASRSSAVYGRSDTVQPAAYYVHIWHRVA